MARSLVLAADNSKCDTYRQCDIYRALRSTLRRLRKAPISDAEVPCIEIYWAFTTVNCCSATKHLCDLPIRLAQVVSRLQPEIA